jgi:hypothetical protein
MSRQAKSGARIVGFPSLRTHRVDEDLACVPASGARRLATRNNTPSVRNHAARCAFDGLSNVIVRRGELRAV